MSALEIAFLGKRGCCAREHHDEHHWRCYLSHVSAGFIRGPLPNTIAFGRRSHCATCWPWSKGSRAFQFMTR